MHELESTEARASAAPTQPRIRRIHGSDFVAELDLDAQIVIVFETEKDKQLEEIGRGRWVPFPPPLDRVRGTIVSEDLERETCIWLEYGFACGTKTWSFEHGPWVEAERAAIVAGVGSYEAELLRLLMWAFYRERWPSKFTKGCGFTSEGYAPLIAEALAEPKRMRARWEMLLMTGGLRWPPGDRTVEDVRRDVLNERNEWDDFYRDPDPMAGSLPEVAHQAAKLAT